MGRIDINLRQRPRRNKATQSIRDMFQETRLHPGDFVYPMFVIDGKNKSVPAESMPGINRLSIDCLVKQAEQAYQLGIRAVALFPNLQDSLKDKHAKESTNPKGLLQKAVKAIKKEIPDICVITDVAMDPYSIDGHDGLLEDGNILNDETLPILADMAVAQARAGADIVAPSDMMDGRIGFIRQALDQNGFTQVGIISYAAKYCSSFYGPFRDALDSTPKSGDKKTYQMNPANARESLREVKLDIDQGADVVMIKPALIYLDIIRQVKDRVDVPVAAYHVSGEYAMIKAAAQQGWLDETKAMTESLLSIKRAGADLIFTYFAVDCVRELSNQ